jgi:hypothetical protein
MRAFLSSFLLLFALVTASMTAFVDPSFAGASSCEMPDCSNIGGNVYCGFDCKNIGGNVYCGEAAGHDCSNIGGNVYCGINCKNIGGNVYCADVGRAKPATPTMSVY